MWIEPLAFLEGHATGLVLACPNHYSRRRVIDCYSALIKKELERLNGSEVALEFEVGPKSSRPPSTTSGNGQLSLPHLVVRQSYGRAMREDFTFDQFVVGNSNDFAYSASLSLASHKNMQTSSLFLLSPTGMGKSHLSQAIGHHILTEKPTNRVYYITAEDFSNEMVTAYRNKAIDKFKDKYRKGCDVLLLEDVHYLSGKERTQIELSLSLDTLCECGKKVIFSSCYLPKDIPRLSDKLRSRFSCSLISTIDPPDFRTRVRILKKKAFNRGYHMPEDVTHLLARELTDDVRQLESGLIGVMARSQLMGTPVDLNLAEAVIKNIVCNRKAITVDTIKKLVCKQYKISTAEISSRSRKQAIVRPRQVAIYLARKYTDAPLQTIGRSFNRYHATALHSINTIAKQIKQQGALQKQVRYLSNKLETGNF